MADSITLDAANAAEDGFSLPAAIEDPAVLTFDAAVVSARHVGKPLFENLKALLNGRVASNQYLHTWVCGAEAVGDPMRVSANDTLTQALATTSGNAQCIGFIRYKPTAISCLLAHFYRKTGLAGGTAGAPVYLTDAGGYSAAPGTIPRVVGMWANATVALLVATPLLCQPTLTSILAFAPVAKIANYQILSQDSGKTFSNHLAPGTITFTFPAVPQDGHKNKIRRSTAQPVVLDFQGINARYGELAGTSFTLYTNGEAVVEYDPDSNVWFVESLSAAQSGLI